MASATHTLGGGEREALTELAAVAALTDERLRVLFDAEVERWSPVDDHLVAPIESLRRLVLEGGKRLRPAFCHWGFHAMVGPGATTARVIDAGAGLELLHAFALAHDDVMDESPSRRGHPTAHIEYADVHRRRAWRGDPCRFGESVAILVGDLGHTYARRLVAAAAPRAQAVWDALETELMLGQYLDVAGTAGGDVPVDQAIRIAQLKSGRYTVARPLELGVALADVGPVPQSLIDYGDAVGLAFQLRDDLLGVRGLSELTGKPVGDDLKEGKPTPLVAIARERASVPERSVLDTIGTVDDDDGVAAILDVLESTGAVREVERRVAELTEVGVGAVTAPGAGIDAEVGSLLAAFAVVLGERSA